MVEDPADGGSYNSLRPPLASMTWPVIQPAAPLEMLMMRAPVLRYFSAAFVTRNGAFTLAAIRSLSYNRSGHQEWMGHCL